MSASDTKTMRGFLDAVKMLVSVPGMSKVNSDDYYGGNESFTIENIEISVDRIDRDQDLEALAEKVGEKFAKALTTKRGTAIGHVLVR